MHSQEAIDALCEALLKTFSNDSFLKMLQNHVPPKTTDAFFHAIPQDFPLT
jgi:hypothetical protein